MAAEDSRTGWSRVFWVLKISLLVYAGFGVFLYFAQRSFMYMPVAEHVADDTPAEYVDVDGARLKVWVVGEPADDAVIYFGGNAENVYYNADDFRRHQPGKTVYLVNYRGYGGSTGSPTEAALFGDAVALFDRIAPRHERVSVIGRSLGSGVATYLASRRPVARSVLVTPHDSALAIARRMYPWYPVGWMLKDRYDSVAHAASVTGPVLLVLAANDTLVPNEHSYRLADAFDDEAVETIVIDGAGHNGISAHERYWLAIAEFLQQDASTSR